uniref:HTH_Tnp_Tc3_1 domain-containing protein n=1 Tax=Heterorhabditis bacteriophora TaxID=37862 RepID=A0A1I7WRZ5_HETBA
MGHAPKLSQHERGQIDAPSTVSYTVKQIADVVKRSRKAIMNFLRRQEEYGTKKSSGRPSKIYGVENAEQVFQYCPMTTEEIIKTDTEACKRKTLLG